MPERLGTFTDERCLVTANANYFVPITLIRTQREQKNSFSTCSYVLTLRFSFSIGLPARSEPWTFRRR
jgi:hypothetical protein